MQVNIVNNYNNQPLFKAKFLNTPAIRKVAQWAVDNGKFEELNNARKQIDFSAVKIRIHLKLATDTEGYPIAIFRRYLPKYNNINNQATEDDYIISKPLIYEGKDKSINPVEFGFKKIIQMGYYVTRNKIFKEIVVHPPNYTNLSER